MSTTSIRSTAQGGPQLQLVTIGTQKWMLRNLNIDKYNNGDSIPQVTDISLWSSLTTGAWCYYNNDPANGKIYGKLYNWYAVNDPRGLTINGFHVPSNSEINTLESYLGGNTNAGGDMKEAGTTHWSAPNTGATNSSGFTALPGGYMWADIPDFFDITAAGLWWTSTAYSTTDSYYYSINNTSAYLNRSNTSKTYGFSVRLIRD